MNDAITPRQHALDAAVRKHASRTIRDIIIMDEMKKHGLWPHDLNPIPNDLTVKNIRTEFQRMLIYNRIKFLH